MESKLLQKWFALSGKLEKQKQNGETIHISDWREMMEIEDNLREIGYPF